MTDWQKHIAASFHVNAALYLAGVFWAGMIYHNPLAWKLALASLGLAALAAAIQLGALHRNAQLFLVLLSWAVGIVAGLLLIPAIG